MSGEEQEGKRFISLRIERALVEKIDARAAELGVSRTQWILRTLQVNLDDNPYARGVPYSARSTQGKQGDGGAD